MTDNVEYLDAPPNMDIPPERVLDGAKGQVDTVLVLGWNDEGEFYMAASTGKAKDLIFMVERFKAAYFQAMMEGDT